MVIKRQCLAFHLPLQLSLLLFTRFLYFASAATQLPMQEAQEMRVGSLGQEDPLEKEMATRSSILAWEILWTEEPGRL